MVGGVSIKIQSLFSYIQRSQSGHRPQSTRRVIILPPSSNVEQLKEENVSRIFKEKKVGVVGGGANPNRWMKGAQKVWVDRRQPRI